MKKELLITVVLLCLMLISTTLDAQVRVFPTGKLSLATSDEPDHNYRISLSGAWFMMGGYQNRYLRYDLSSADPRIWSTTNRIIFYNTDLFRFQDLEARNYYQASDRKLKTNIETIQNGLDIITQIRGTKYNWISDLNSSSKQEVSKDIGFIAQEIEKIIPEAVVTDSLDNKLISYSSILVYTVEAIKELSYIVQKQEIIINELKEKNTFKSGELKSSSSAYSEMEDEVLLLSNVPNPFTKKTEISYYIPKSINNAILIVYDLQGIQKKRINITERGSGSISIDSVNLQAGMYLYTLIADEKEIDTKRMVLME